MKTKLLIFLLFLITATSTTKAQQKEHDYIPLFDTNKVWYTVVAEEFGGWIVEELEIYYKHVLNINDTLYYLLSDYGYYREDTLTKKVFARDDYHPEYPEMLIYDFSLQQGDSIRFYSYWYYVDSIKNEIIFNKGKNVFYINNHYPNAPNIIWIEGIGSLAGPPYSAHPPSFDWMSRGHLTCYYDSDTLIYQSDYGELYGCSFEYLDIGELDTELLTYRKLNCRFF